MQVSQPEEKISSIKASSSMMLIPAVSAFFRRGLTGLYIPTPCLIVFVQHVVGINSHSCRRTFRYRFLLHPFRKDIMPAIETSSDIEDARSKLLMRLPMFTNCSAVKAVPVMSGI